eukprot:scaffold13863_cov35-Tisochrysis_lutea.AAC.3
MHLTHSDGWVVILLGHACSFSSSLPLGDVRLCWQCRSVQGGRLDEVHLAPNPVLALETRERD